MALLSDEEMEVMLSECVPHKIVIDTAALVACANSYCNLMLYNGNGEIVQDNADVGSIVAEDARWMQEMEVEFTRRFVRASKAIASKYKK